MNITSAAVFLSKEQTQTQETLAYNATLSKIAPTKDQITQSGIDVDDGSTIVASDPFHSGLFDPLESSADKKGSKRKYKTEGVFGHQCRLVRLHRLGKTVIFLKDLKKITKEETVQQIFEQYGKVVHLQLPFNSKKKRNLGYCYVVFEDATVGQHLLNIVKEVEIDGRQVALSPFSERTSAKKEDIKRIGMVVDESFDQLDQSTEPLDQQGSQFTDKNLAQIPSSNEEKALKEEPETSPGSPASMSFVKPTTVGYSQLSRELEPNFKHSNLVFKLRLSYLPYRHTAW